jgi:oxidase EvaA
MTVSYKQFLKRMSFALRDEDASITGNKLSVEFLVEQCAEWPSYMTYANVLTWYADIKKKCKMSIYPVSIDDCVNWRLNSDKTKIVHDSNDFFSVDFIRVTNTDSREVVNGWCQPIVTQVGYKGGIIGLLRTVIGDVPHYLVQAKAEPGNPELVQISPTLQVTYSNINKAHGGARPKLADIFLNPDSIGAKVLFDNNMPEDGGRFYLKTNRGIILQLDGAETFLNDALDDSFTFLTLWQIKKLINTTTYVGPHIRNVVSFL